MNTQHSGRPCAPKIPSFGFTFIDLLICLSVLGILTVLGTPALSHMLEKNRADTANSQIIHLLRYTRQLAVENQHVLTLCGVDSAGNCSHDWFNNEIFSFVDRNNDHSLDEGEEILHRTRFRSGGGVIHWRGAFGRKYLRYQNDGTAMENGSFYYCPANNDNQYAKRVTVNRAGRSYFGLDRNGDGIVENSSGNNIDCDVYD